MKCVTIPVWILLAPMAAGTMLLFYRDRRFPPGCCFVCGYDLRGADHERCPECGVPVATAQKQGASPCGRQNA